VQSWRNGVGWWICYRLDCPLIHVEGFEVQGLMVTLYLSDMERVASKNQRNVINN
jgi:hypothetical protein